MGDEVLKVRVHLYLCEEPARISAPGAINEGKLYKVCFGYPERAFFIIASKSRHK